ncbi:MAG: peptide chain release factor N(5)-glutamine methyltransferase [Candidatus Hydrogenedentota bacterium]|nr:MAG: peptide chain release factor N(5)-glutamine methyltransferase [Candidatus Hydrogenedentota bacterium]
MSYREALRLLTARLKKVTNQPRFEAELLLAFVRKISREKLLLDDEKEIPPEEWKLLNDLCLQREIYKPMAYILQEKEFFGLKFFVNQHTLIPRPETEILVEEVLKHLQSRSNPQPISILDMGCGSGCIGLSLAHEYTGKAHYFLTDISFPALQVAKQNQKRLLPEKKIYFIAMNQLLGFSTTFDVIVSNPPYVTEQEYDRLQLEIQHFEPKQALVPSKNFFENLFASLNTHLSNKGVFFMETNPNFIEKHAKQLTEKGFFVQTIPDYTGQNHFIKAQWHPFRKL